MKKFIKIGLVTVVILAAIFFVIRIFDSKSYQKEAQTILSDDVIKNSLKTTTNKEISVISKEKYDAGFLVFYLNSPINASQQYDLKQTDIGFAFFHKKNNNWVKEDSGEYGTMDSYLKKSDKGYTFEFFPNDKKNSAPIIFGIISDPKIKSLDMKNVNSGQKLPVHYVKKNDIKIWYSLLEEPFNDNFTLTAIGEDKELSEQNINVSDYKFSESKQ